VRPPLRASSAFPAQHEGRAIVAAELHVIGWLVERAIDQIGVGLNAWLFVPHFNQLVLQLPLFEHLACNADPLAVLAVAVNEILQPTGLGNLSPVF